jgi:GTPase SAR1 family protein
MTSLSEFQGRRRAASAALGDVADGIVPEELGLEAEIDALRSLSGRLRDGRFRVLLIGCFSAGKSTLLNALCGEPVLPVKVNPCTAILTEVRWGEQPGVEVHRGESVESMSLPAFLAEYQLRATEVSEAGAEVTDRFSGVDKAVLSWPLGLLRDGVSLVDTPGLDDDEVRTARTLSSLPEADAVIFVLNASRFLTDLERRLVRQQLLPRGLTNLFFPVTMADLLEALSDDPAGERDRVRSRAEQVLTPLCQVDGRSVLDERFFLLDARGALLSRWDRTQKAPRIPPDEAALRKSGVPTFEAALARFLVEERGRVEIERTFGAIRRLRSEVGRRAELDRATALATAEELRKRQEDLLPQFAELEAIARRVGRTVDGFVERQKIAVWQDLRDFLARTEEDLPDAVARFDLGALRGIDLLTPRGRDRVEAHIKEQLETWLAERTAAWQQEMRPRLEGSLAQLKLQLAGDASDFDRLSAGIITDFTGGVTLLVDDPQNPGGEPGAAERWVSVAMGAVFLSPASMAAGWTEGYEGALKGFGFWVAKIAIATLLGPVGWAALLVYVLADALLLVLTGQGQLKKVRDQVAVGLRGKLVARADAVKDEIARNVGDGLAPLRDGIVAAADADATRLKDQLERTISQRERTLSDASSRGAAWGRVEGLLSGAEETLVRVFAP